MRAWQIFALLIGVAINSIVQKIGPDAAIVEQSVALARCTITGKGFPAALRLNQEAQQLALGRANTIGKIDISLKLV